MKRFVLLAVSFLMATVLFAGPFGLEMGMTLEEIKAKCGGKEPEYKGRGYVYKIEPIKKDRTFTDYSACVHDSLGLFSVGAFTDFMSTESCEVVLNIVLSALKDYYGEPSESKKLSCEWHVSECEKLKKEKLRKISVVVQYGDHGYGMLALGYIFENGDRALESVDSPF